MKVSLKSCDEVSPQSFYSKTPKLESGSIRKIYRSIYCQENNKKNEENFIKAQDSNVSRRLTLFRSIDLSKLNENNSLFSVEKDQNGKRTFFINTYEEIFNLFRSLEEPHIYEVIVEQRPCHLYFDVEYKIEEHPDYDGDKMVQTLIALVEEKLFEVFGQDGFELIHLDATSPVKFSRHIIIRGNHFCFADNRQVATFVQKEILTNSEMALIVDPAVYSRNRNFRCIWSTKKANGGKYPLVPIDGTHKSPLYSSVEYFKKTLITNVGANPHCLRYPEEATVKWNSSSYDGKITMPDLKQSDLQCTGIESFALSVFAPNGTIRNARYSPDFKTITFLINGCRYCHRIGREHKSNGIYLVVRLSSATIVQKCFDPDCRGFESSPVPIPENIFHSLLEECENFPQSFNPQVKKANIQSVLKE